VLALLAYSGRDQERFRRDIEHEVRYANIAIIEGIGASQHGIGMVSARIAEIVLRNERAVIPIGSYNPLYGRHADAAKRSRPRRSRTDPRPGDV